MSGRYSGKFRVYLHPWHLDELRRLAKSKAEEAESMAAYPGQHFAEEWASEGRKWRGILEELEDAK